jgi:hypothetical protein
VGRGILLTPDDFDIRVGHPDGVIMAKTLFVE